MNTETVTKRSSASYVANVAICAALYAVVNGLTALIPVPLIVGEFRPGVVIPALFTIASGTRVGALGAAFGSLIGDVIFLTPLGKTNPFLALVAGFPANLIGFLVFGLIINRAKSWSAYTYGTLTALFVGNFVAAFAVVETLLYKSPLTEQVSQMLLFTFFWLGTMVPFMLLLLPVLVRALMTSQVSARWLGGISTWKEESLSTVFMYGLVCSVPLFIAFALSYQPFFYAFLGGVAGWFKGLTLLSAVFMLLAPSAPYLAKRAK